MEVKTKTAEGKKARKHREG